MTRFVEMPTDGRRQIVNVDRITYFATHSDEYSVVYFGPSDQISVRMTVQQIKNLVEAERG